MYMNVLLSSLQLDTGTDNRVTINNPLRQTIQPAEAITQYTNSNISYGHFY